MSRVALGAGARRCGRVRARAPSAYRDGCPPAARPRTARSRSASRTAPAGRRRLRDPRVQRGVDAADHRRQVRHEHEPDRRARAWREALRDLRQWRWPGHAVSLEVVRRLGEAAVCTSALRPAPRHAGLGIGDQVLEVDDARLDAAAGSRAAPRSDSSRGWRRCARARIALAVDLGQPVHRLARRARGTRASSCTSAPTRATSLMRKSAARSIDRARRRRAARAPRSSRRRSAWRRTRRRSAASASRVGSVNVSVARGRAGSGTCRRPACPASCAR